LKELLLNIIEQRHADQNAFALALLEWEQSIANPEEHPKFLQAYANELRDALVKSNRRRKATREAMEQLANTDWKTLVKRELQTEDWFDTVRSKSKEENTAKEVPLV
jgi:hypothetical protein